MAGKFIQQSFGFDDTIFNSDSFILKNKEEILYRIHKGFKKVR